MKVLLIFLLFIFCAVADKEYNIIIKANDKGVIKEIKSSENLVFNYDLDSEDRSNKTHADYGMPLVMNKENPSGWMMEIYDGDYDYCDSFTNAPGVNTWSTGSKAVILLLGLFYAFLGVGIVADIFMASIEVITAQEITVSNDFGDGGEKKTIQIKVKVWNDTVANLTLLALGSSAPEILLAVIETVTTLGEPAGALGPATIVGSASFNLFMISAICALSVPDGEERHIDQVGVFAITATSSVFAYLWMFLCIVVISPDTVQLWEAYITFLMFPLLVGVAYAQDVRLFYAGINTQYKIASNVESSIREIGDKMELADAKPHEIASKVQQNMLASKSPLWWRINGTRYLSGKMPLIKKGDKIERIEERPDVSTVDPTKDYHDIIKNKKYDTEFSFSIPQYTVYEDEGTIKITVHRNGNKNGEHTIDFETIDGTAIGGEDYEHTTGTLVFKSGQKMQQIEVKIYHDEEVEDNEFFGIQLANPSGRNVGLGQNKLANVIIIDVSSPGSFQFPQSATQCSERIGEIKVPVQRVNGSMDKVQVTYETRPGSAVNGLNYERVFGTLVFENTESLKYITVQILDDKNYEEQDLDFSIMLSGPTNKSSIVDGRGTINISITDDAERSKIVGQVLALLGQGYDLSTHTWRQQFEEAMSFEGQPGDYFAMVMHSLTFPWKIIFACLPPTSYYDGWLTFGSSLGAIGLVTMVIGDLASTWGCMVGLDEGFVGMSVVALGTSMPDTFASITATQMAPNADAAIGNITGSNSVNVFLGLGLPWCIATIYHAIKGTTYETPGGSLSFSVGVFIPLAITCLGIMYYRNSTGVGALGGSKSSREWMAYFFMFEWVFFLVMAMLQIQGVINV